MSRVSQFISVMNQENLYSNYEWDFNCDSLSKQSLDYAKLRREYKKQKNEGNPVTSKVKPKDEILF